MLAAGAGLQGPAGVRTDGPPVDDEPMTSHGEVDLGPASAERQEGIVGPSGIYCMFVLYMPAPCVRFVCALCVSVCALC